MIADMAFGMENPIHERNIQDVREATIERAKPHGYSLFNMDVFANAAHILSTPENNLRELVTRGGKSIELGMDFTVPYIEDKSSWTYGEDIDIQEKWPVRHPVI